jgi:hypothetical protein
MTLPGAETIKAGIMGADCRRWRSAPAAASSAATTGLASIVGDGAAVDPSEKPVVTNDDATDDAVPVRWSVVVLVAPSM